MKNIAIVLCLISLSGCYRSYQSIDGQVREMFYRCDENSFRTKKNQGDELYTMTIECKLKVEK